jgi:hypothetical protein
MYNSSPPPPPQSISLSHSIYPFPSLLCLSFSIFLPVYSFSSPSLSIHPFLPLYLSVPDSVSEMLSPCAFIGFVGQVFASYGFIFLFRFAPEILGLTKSETMRKTTIFHSKQKKICFCFATFCFEAP